MNRNKLCALFAFGAAILAPRAAFAACSSSLPYTFQSGSALSSATTNANNNALLACALNVDNSQIGSSGIYASQIKPGNGSQATFGGSQAYTFPLGINANGRIVTNDTIWAGQGSNGEYWQTENGFSAHQYIDSSHNLGWFDATDGYNSGVTINLPTGLFTAQNINANQGIAAGGNITWGSGATGGTLNASNGNINGGGSLNMGGALNGASLSVTGGAGVGSLNVAGTSTTHGISDSAQITSLINATPSQVLPAIVNGSSFTGQSKAHIDAQNIAISGSGAQTNTFVLAFDAAPVCTATYNQVGILSTSIPPLSVQSTATTVTVTGQASYNAFVVCVGS